MGGLEITVNVTVFVKNTGNKCMNSLCVCVCAKKVFFSVFRLPRWASADPVLLRNCDNLRGHTCFIFCAPRKMFFSCMRTYCRLKAKVKYRVRTLKFIWAPCHVMCTAVLIGWDLATPPPPHSPRITRGAIGQQRWTTSPLNPLAEIIHSFLWLQEKCTAFPLDVTKMELLHCWKPQI